MSLCFFVFCDDRSLDCFAASSVASRQLVLPSLTVRFYALDRFTSCVPTRNPSRHPAPCGAATQSLEAVGRLQDSVAETSIVGFTKWLREADDTLLQEVLSGLRKRVSREEARVIRLNWNRMISEARSDKLPPHLWTKEIYSFSLALEQQSVERRWPLSIRRSVQNLVAIAYNQLCHCNRIELI